MIKERKFRKVALTCCVVEKVHTDFGDHSGLMHGGLGAVAAAFRQAAIAVEVGIRLLTLVSWLRNGGETTFVEGGFAHFADVALIESS